MRWKTALRAVLGLVAAAAVFAAPGLSQEDPPRITKEEVKALLGDRNVSILDARITPDWRGSDRKIAGAVRVDPLDVGTWADKFPKERKLVVYCA